MKEPALQRFQCQPVFPGWKKDYTNYLNLQLLAHGIIYLSLVQQWHTSKALRGILLETNSKQCFKDKRKINNSRHLNLQLLALDVCYLFLEPLQLTMKDPRRILLESLTPSSLSRTKQPSQPITAFQLKAVWITPIPASNYSIPAANRMVSVTY